MVVQGGRFQMGVVLRKPTSRERPDLGRFELFAIDALIDVQPTSDAFETRANVMKAIQGHVLGKAVCGGRCRRPQ